MCSTAHQPHLLYIPNVPSQKKLNLTKTVRKLPINEDLERAGRYMFQDDTQHRTGPKYDDALPVQIPVEDWSVPLTHENFKDTLAKYDIGTTRGNVCCTCDNAYQQRSSISLPPGAPGASGLSPPGRLPPRTCTSATQRPTGASDLARCVHDGAHCTHVGVDHTSQRIDIHKAYTCIDIHIVPWLWSAISDAPSTDRLHPGGGSVP